MSEIVERFLKANLSKKIKTDVLWNILSFGVTGLCGILILLIIMKVYDSSVLGIFNLFYAIYMLLSQLVGAGIHFSVLKYAAQFSEDNEKIQIILSAGMVSTILISISILFIIYLFRGVFKIFFDDQSIAGYIFLIFPALFFLAINKVLLAFHNACRRMVAFAIFSGFRSILWILSLIGFVFLSIAPYKIAVIFSFSEFTLFILLLIYSFKYFDFTISKDIFSWIKSHILFGFKALCGSIFVDINTRIDVMVLGIFSSDKFVGIYSTAAMVVDGFNQFSVVFRTIINPIVTKYKFNRSKTELENLIMKGRNLFFKIKLPIGFLLILCFPLFIRLLHLNPEYSQAWLPLLILMTGSMIRSGYAPFLMIFNQTGYPGIQSILYLLIFLTNLLLNFILVPLWGMQGAAAATAISYVSFVFYLKVLTLRKLEIKI